MAENHSKIMNDHHKDNVHAMVWRHVVAGAGSGWMTSLITCPLDVIKVRLQSNPSLSLPSHPSALLRRVWKREGIRGFYRGLGLTMVGYLPSFSIYFPAYHQCKVAIAKQRGTNQQTDPVAHLLSAIIAGTITNVTTNPLWVIRTRLMTQHIMKEPLLYRGSFDAFCSILTTEGIRGLYKGASVSVIGVLHVAVQFPTYEWLKRCLSNPGDPPSTWNIFLASTMSKVLASTITYPHEIIRTRLQIQRNAFPKYSGVLDACRKIWWEEGWRGFYRGLQVNVLRVIPASGVTFVTYETILKYYS